MIRQDLYLYHYDWEVIVYYNTTREDADEILHLLQDMDTDEDTFVKARRNLLSGLADTGLTFSNPSQRVSVIVLSHCSSPAEFSNSWYHEVKHCAEHIALADGLPLAGEPTAYIGGYLARSMHPIASTLLCPHCNHKEINN